MSKTKIAITMDEEFLHDIDALVQKQVFENRSQAIQQAVQEKLARLKHIRLTEELAKLDTDFKKSMAEEGLAEDVNRWPKY